MGISYNPATSSSGLVFALDAGNPKSYPGSGNTCFDIAGNNNGTLLNGVSYSSNNGGSFSFDGTNDYISVNNLGFRDHTIEGWIYSRDGSQGGTDGNTIISVIGTYTPTGGVAGKYTYIGVLGSNTLTYRIDDGNISHRLVADVNYVANQWYYVALTYNSNGSTKAYLNGSIVGSVNYTPNIIFNSIPFNVARAQNGIHFNGLVSSIRAYNKELTLEEIKTNYNGLKNRFGL